MKSVTILMHAGAKKAGTKGMQRPCTVGSHNAWMGRHIIAKNDTRAMPHMMRNTRITRDALFMPFPTKMRRYMRTMETLTKTRDALYTRILE